jgi:hypothetical protein
MRRMDGTLAAKIYRHKIAYILRRIEDNSARLDRVAMSKECSKLARKFGVRARCVNDIWTHKSWVIAACHFWKASYEIEVKRFLFLGIYWGIHRLPY